jgi:hypothetical protein
LPDSTVPNSSHPVPSDSQTERPLLNAFPPPNQFNTIPGDNGLLVGITPAGTLTPDLSIPCSQGPQEGNDGPSNDKPQACPYARDRLVPAIAEVDLADSILESLQKLIDAEALIEQARELVKDAKYADAIECVNKACTLCPMSHYQEMAAEVVSSIVWHFLTGRREDAEEQVQPPIECEPYWYDEDFPSPKCPPSPPPQSSATIMRRNDVVLLHNATAVEVANTIKTYFHNSITILRDHGCPPCESDDSSNVVVAIPDPITNKLLISAEPRYYTEVMRLIQEIDTAPAQVVIQVLIAEINLDGCSDWLTAGGDAPFLFSASQDTFERLIRNLKTQGRLDVLTRPQVQAVDNQSARVCIGQQFPVITGTTIDNCPKVCGSPENQPVGVELNLTPKIEQDGRVVMRVAMTKGDEQKLETTATVHDSHTVAIVCAGRTSVEMIEKSVPCLGHMKVVGSLFHYHHRVKSTSVTLVLLTPHVVHSKADADKILEQEMKRTDRILSPEAKQSQSYPAACGMPCLQVPGVDAQVSGLMKVCHLALSCGHHGKAVRLAREAYALDAERVAADPVVYKMHLLDLKMIKGKCCCDDDCCCDPCDCPDCCCHQAKVNESFHYVPWYRNCPSCPVVGMRLPALPDIDPQVVIQLQKLVEDGSPAVSEGKPKLEVIEEESEATEVPQAVAKPYRVQAPAANTVISYDDLLRLIPGETWSELDLNANRVRILWRGHLGHRVYRIRYDGGLSVDLSVMPPAGTVENCEDPR